MGSQDIDVKQLEKEAELYQNPLTEKQKDILQAAEDLFSKRGFLETPTAEIARQANVTEKTLFKHFPSKEDLLRRILFPLILRTLLPTQMRKMKHVFADEARSFGEAFLAFARDRIAEVWRNKSKVKFVLTEVLRNDKFRQQLHDIWVEQVWQDAVAVVERAQKDGKIRDDVKPATIVRMQVALVAGYTARKVLFANGEKLDDEKELTEMLEVLLHGIAR